MKTNSNNNKGSILQAGVLCPEGKKSGLQRSWNVRPLSLLCARCLHTCPPHPYPAWKAEALCLHFKEEEDYSLHRCCYLPPLSSPQVFKECKFSTITASWVSLLHTWFEGLHGSALGLPWWELHRSSLLSHAGTGAQPDPRQGQSPREASEGPKPSEEAEPTAVRAMCTWQHAQTGLLASQAWTSGSVTPPFPLSPSPDLPAPVDVGPPAPLIPLLSSPALAAPSPAPSTAPLVISGLQLPPCRRSQLYVSQGRSDKVP